MGKLSRTHHAYLSRAWLLFLSLATFILSVAVAHSKDNMYVFAGGAIIAILISLPVWWRWSRYLLVALVVYLPFEDAFVPPVHPGSTVVRVLPDAILLIMFCGRALLEVQRRKPFFGTPLDWPLAFMLVVSLISMLLNHVRPALAVQGPYLFLRYAVLFYLTASSGFLQRDIRIIMRLLIWTGIVESVLGLIQFALLSTSGYKLFGEPFVQGTMNHSNVLGTYLAVICTIAIAMYSRDVGSYGRAELLLLIGLSSIAVVTAVSRQSIIALIIGVGIILLVRHRLHDRLRISGQVLLAGVAGFATGSFLLGPGTRTLNALWNRVVHPAGSVGAVTAPAPTPTAGVAQATSVANTPSVGGEVVTPPPTPTVSGSTSASPYSSMVNDKAQQLSNLSGYITHISDSGGRLYEILQAGPQILKRSPWFGLGPGTFGNQATFSDWQFYASLHVGSLVSDRAHDYLSDVEWMTVFGQLGLLGVAGFIWIFGAMGVIGFRAVRTARMDLTRRLGMICMAFVPMFLFLGWTGPNFELRPISVLPWFITGLVISLQRNELADKTSQLGDVDTAEVTAVPVPQHVDLYDGWDVSNELMD